MTDPRLAHTRRTRPGGPRTWFDRVRATVFLVLVHAVPPVAFMLGTRPTDWLAFAIIYPTLAVATGVGLHRYFAHAAFATSRPVQFVMAWMACLTFVDPISFAGKHRLHHRFSDTDRDVHSPAAGFWFCWFGSLIDEGYAEEDLVGAAPDLTRFPELRWLHRNFVVPGVSLWALLFLTGGFTLFAVGYCLSVVIVLHQTSALNYFCHRWGYRRYDTPDGSRNNPLVAFVTFGEGWHNNHHRFPRAARAGVAWWELDPLHAVIRACAACGLVWDLVVAPRDDSAPRRLLSDLAAGRD